MCMSVLQVCMPVLRLCTWCPPWSEEDAEAGVMDSCDIHSSEMLCECREEHLGPLQAT